MRSLITEIKKTKRRFIWAMLPAVLLLDFVWMGWIFAKAQAQELAEGYYNLLTNLPMINTITLPIMMAVIASRLCDMENKGNTYKLLCTLQKKGEIFRNKLILGSLYLLVFTILQFFVIRILGWQYQIPQVFPWEQVGYYLLSTFITSLILLLLQEILSLMMDNQLYPFFIGLMGTFLGIFSWFFPNQLRYVIPWGYYSVGCTISYTWDRDTRIMDFYTVPFSYGGFAVLLLFGVFIYVFGKHLFVGKEI